MDEIKKNIDVIIPCYNVEETIEDCIKSLCNQSLSKNEYNCYFINDCSKDSTGTILDKYKNIERLDVIKGAGHCPHDEYPEITNNLINDFLQEIK